MCYARTSFRGEIELYLSPRNGDHTRINFTLEQWEQLKKFFGVELLLRLEKRVNGDFGAPPHRWEEYKEAANFAKKWEERTRPKRQ